MMMMIDAVYHLAVFTVRTFSNRAIYLVSCIFSYPSLNKKLSYLKDSAGRRSLRRSRSFNVTDFGTNRKPIFLLSTAWVYLQPLLCNWPPKLSRSVRQRKVTAIMSLKVIQRHGFWYQLKAHMRLPISDYTNMHPISHCFQVIADYWSNLQFRQVYLSLNTFVCSEPLNSGPQNLASGY